MCAVNRITLVRMVFIEYKKEEGEKKGTRWGSDEVLHVSAVCSADGVGLTR